MNGVRVPEAVAAMPPGPELAAVLNGLDHGAVANADTVALAQAWARQLAHVQARFLDAMVHVGRSEPFSGSAGEAARRRAAAGEWAAAELAAAMRWTHRHAELELDFAESVVGMPIVFAACDAGVLDRDRAWAFADVLDTADLTGEQVEAICSAMVPPAPRWTVTQLRSRLVRMVLEIDPGYTTRRYKAAVRDRGVTGYLGKDGTGTVTGHGLAADEAIAACERLEALADEVRRAGHPGTVGQVRADLFTRLLDGRFHGMDREQMIAAMLAEVGTGDNGSEGDGAALGGPAPESGHTESGHTESGHTESGHTESGDTDSGDTDSGDTESGDTVGRPTAGRRDGAGTGSGGTATGAAGGRPPAGAGRAESADGATGELSGGEVRVGLGTLLGLDERCGEVPGWGPVLADVARSMVATRRGAEWRFAITDEDGYLLFAGVTRRRPRGIGRSHDGVVEIHVRAALLGELAAGGAGEWDLLVADLARQYADRERLREILRRYPGHRFAAAALRRHVQVRDRRCVAPGCRRPARRCQLDHTVDHALGGETLEENSGPLCARHHLMKHEGGWQLEQTSPGLFRWTSPLGQVYVRRGEPISPQVGPIAPRVEVPGSWWEPTRSLEYPIMERRATRVARPTPRPPPDDEPPPF